MKFNKFNLITASLYVLGFIFILLNFLSVYFNLVATILFSVASVMLTISFYFSCKRKNAILEANSEEIIMELSVEDGMETYVPKEKKKGKTKEFIETLRIFTPAILSGLLALATLALFVLSLINL